MIDITPVRAALATFPVQPLSHLPTPLEPLMRWPVAASDSDIRIKRDDCTGLAMGGNKSRQLAFYIGDALSQGCDTLLSTGAVQSNYMRILAAAAAKCGLQCHIQLEDRVKNKSEDYTHSGNVLLDNLFGATVHHYPHGEDEAGADAALTKLSGQLKAQGRKPYIVPLGGDHKPMGALGYVDAALELLQQFSDTDWWPDVIVVGSGSGLTHTGLLCGLRMAGSDIPVIGACVRREAELQRSRIESHCTRLQAMLGLPLALSADDILLDDRALWPGYGEQSQMVMQAIHDMAEHEGIVLDPVYSGKAAAVLMDRLLKGEIAPGQRAVLVHTGGTPAVFAYRQKMQEIADL